ncbi:16S rRNA (guanine(966)-N(2))-methyltransferase RsmD [Vagococcus penaei]|uniref:16S rRNA (Guanine(966)-N(2))-methyltransferase RsmD n=1 Tax=Vagococcus penaei TaxID=633807 RepID=A0A1Q2D4S0_9ENTE|nr:16S rRNA (guanine(966)-N(2))-methyltransferase RsmD [Vagococcus penaei]AQP53237.1 16S rRNA (guanine(966)-N(2))-methyltransferase RsmD [Vagococcus penaei]RST98683.1 16S rRNA (guanine(966)-N(2))-methyltransferase RsmD [Vagococcus penaei]
MRVIAGDFKGRKLNSLQGSNTRPTSDKIKGAIFNRIGPYFDGDIVLDLYSGSGNLAIEAISRGCSKAYCFDNHFQAIKVIQSNVALTKSESQITVTKMDADKALLWLKANEITVDLVFLDPPYAKQKIVEQMETMLELKLMNDSGLIVCEVDKKFDLPDDIKGQLEKIKEQSYSLTKIIIYQKN